MTKTTITLAGAVLLMTVGNSQAAPDPPAFDASPCDPDVEDCCPVYDWFFTLQMRHWWACVPDVGTGGGPRDA